MKFVKGIKEIVIYFGSGLLACCILGIIVVGFRATFSSTLELIDLNEEVYNAGNLEELIENLASKDRVTDKASKRYYTLLDEYKEGFISEHNEIVEDYEREIETRDETIDSLISQIEDLGYEPIY